MQPSADQFDPYFQWLGIDPALHPLDHYTLLGLPHFTGDAATVAAAADQRMQLIRSFQTGPRGAYTQKLMNELSSARVCLTNPAMRAQYDAQLHQQLGRRAIAQMPQAADPGASSGYGATWQQGYPSAGGFAPQSGYALPVASYGDPAPPPGAMLASSAGAPPIAPRAAAQSATEEPADDAVDEPESSAARWPIVVLAVSVLVLLVVTGGVLYQRFGGSSRDPAAVAEAGDSSGEQGVTDDSETTSDPTSEGATAEPMAGERQPLGANLVEMMQEGSGEVNLIPSAAVIEGPVMLKLEGLQNVLANFGDATAAATWHYKVVKPGFFQLEVEYTLDPAVEEAKLILDVNAQTKTITLRPLETTDPTSKDRFTVAITRSGKGLLRIAPPSDRAAQGLVIHSLRLIPVGQTSDGAMPAN